jgi:hypothetical protein
MLPTTRLPAIGQKDRITDPCVNSQPLEKATNDILIVEDEKIY